MAITTFKADVHHVAGLNVTATSTHHTITVDEPESLGGTDKGPNPVELLLDALGSCQAIAINAFAPKFKVKIKKLGPFAVWCGWVCQVVTVLRSSLPQVR